MRVRLHLFAALRDIVGEDRQDLELGRDATPEDVWRDLVAAHPALGAHRIPLVAINEEYASPDVALSDGDDLAFIPPVSGG